jgi:hypothetical protein
MKERSSCSSSTRHNPSSPDGSGRKIRAFPIDSETVWVRMKVGLNCEMFCCATPVQSSKKGQQSQNKGSVMTISGPSLSIFQYARLCAWFFVVIGVSVKPKTQGSNIQMKFEEWSCTNGRWTFAPSWIAGMAGALSLGMGQGTIKLECSCCVFLYSYVLSKSSSAAFWSTYQVGESEESKKQYCKCYRLARLWASSPEFSE